MSTTTQERRGETEIEGTTGPPIDPRIRARRVAIARSAGRRRLRRLLVVLSVVVGLLAVASLVYTPLLDVDHITVAGEYRTDPADIVAAGGVDLGDPLARVDLEATARRVERLPWVDEATVVRSWPGTLRYRVVERVPVAAVRADDDTWLAVDRDGHVVITVPQAPEGLPVVEGVSLDADVGAAAPAQDAPAFALAGALPASIRPLVAAVSVEGDGAVTVRLTAGGEATVGDGSDIEAKAVALASVLAAVDPCVATLDVSLPSAPVLTRVPGCS